jgi:PST family polysaccharide transporter
MLATAARKLGFPTFAKLQHDRDRLRRAYARMSRILYSVALPGYVGLALVAEEAIVLVAGERWRASGLIASVLLLTGPAQALQAYTGGLLNGIGRPDITLRYRFVTALVNIGGFVAAVVLFRSPLAVAVAYALRAYLLAPIVMRWIERYAGIPFAENLRPLRRIAGATALMAVSVLLVKAMVPRSIGASPFLGVEIIVGAAVYLVVMLVIERDLLVDLWHFARQALPDGLHRRLFGARRGASS